MKASPLGIPEVLASMPLSVAGEAGCLSIASKAMAPAFSSVPAVSPRPQRNYRRTLPSENELISFPIWQVYAVFRQTFSIDQQNKTSVLE